MEKQDTLSRLTFTLDFAKFEWNQDNVESEVYSINNTNVSDFFLMQKYLK